MFPLLMSAWSRVRPQGWRACVRDSPPGAL